MNFPTARVNERECKWEKERRWEANSRCLKHQTEVKWWGRWKKKRNSFLSYTFTEHEGWKKERRSYTHTSCTQAIQTAKQLCVLKINENRKVCKTRASFVTHDSYIIIHFLGRKLMWERENEMQNGAHFRDTTISNEQRNNVVMNFHK